MIKTANDIKINLILSILKFPINKEKLAANKIKTINKYPQSNPYHYNPLNLY